jgi:hypothetical protein
LNFINTLFGLLTIEIFSFFSATCLKASLKMCITWESIKCPILNFLSYFGHDFCNKIKGSHSSNPLHKKYATSSKLVPAISLAMQPLERKAHPAHNETFKCLPSAITSCTPFCIANLQFQVNLKNNGIVNVASSESAFNHTL